MTQHEIFYAIADERRYQNTKWGEANDDNNVANDWAAYITTYVAKALNVVKWSPFDFDKQRAAIVKVAALAVAWAEAVERQHEAFDEQTKALKNNTLMPEPETNVVV